MAEGLSFFLHSQKAPESCTAVPQSLISFNSPSSPVGNCHNILTFKTITEIILVSCFKKKKDKNNTNGEEAAAVCDHEQCGISQPSPTSSPGAALVQRGPQHPGCGRDGKGSWREDLLLHRAPYPYGRVVGHSQF